MYVVRDKKTKKIVHINPAPLKQALEGKDIYFKFDARKMEIGKSEGPLPEHFDITADGEIIEPGLEEKMEAGIIELEPHQKVENGEIVEKTLAEVEQIVAKTSAEMLEEGAISLDEIKQQKKDYFSALALQQRNEILPDYKIQNALMGIYDARIAAAYKETVEAFREEFHRLEEMIDGAKSLDELDKIKAGFPKAVPGLPSGTHAAASPESSKAKPSPESSTVKPSADSSKVKPSPDSPKVEPSSESSKVKVKPSTEPPKVEPSPDSLKVEPSPEPSKVEPSKVEPSSEQSKVKPPADSSKAKPSSTSSTVKPSSESSTVKPSSESSKAKPLSKSSKAKPSSKSSKVKQAPRGKKKDG